MKEFENSWLIAKWGDVKLKAVVGNMKRFKSKTNFFFFWPGKPICKHKFHRFSCSQAEFLHIVLRGKGGKNFVMEVGIL